jgi:hypothetical protein
VEVGDTLLASILPVLAVLAAPLAVIAYVVRRMSQE